MKEQIQLSQGEQLTLHQLRLLEWAEGYSKKENTVEDNPSTVREQEHWLPALWTLTRNIQLAPWQEDARDSWFAAGRRGTIKAVTGVGKTLVALAIAEQLQHEDPDLRVAIVVPTIVLMNQWFDTLREHSNLPESSLARLGGGYSDDLDETRRIIVAVLASARRELPTSIKKWGAEKHLLLVADECHRAGAPEMSAVFQTLRQYSLGLSATPERDDEAEGESTAEYVTSILGQEIGPIVYEMTFAEAIRLGVLPPFEIHHLGLTLSPAEARRYEALSRSINETRRELMSASLSARNYSGERLVAWARRTSARGRPHLSNLAYRFLNDTTRRKQLLYRAECRVAATRQLVHQSLGETSDARIILFHESIAEVVSLYILLRNDGFPVVMEHSQLPAQLREETLELFRAGTAKVIVSARSLIEGFNVPEADLGIIVASSSSPRQRIQSVGRVLRNYRNRDGETKTSRVCVLYIRDSVDEHIYEREDWDNLVGLDRNRYFLWNPPEQPVEVQTPPRMVVPREDDIDFGVLSFGDEYPGRYEGSEFSTDSQGNITDPGGLVAMNPQGIPALVQRLKGQPGRFRVTTKKAAVLVRIQTQANEWTTLYGGILAEPFEFGIESGVAESIDIARLVPGDPYPGPIQAAVEFRFRQRLGGVISKRVPGGEAFAHGPGADRLISALRDIGHSQRPPSRIYVNDLGHAFWRKDGLPHFLAALDGQLEFPLEVSHD